MKQIAVQLTEPRLSPEDHVRLTVLELAVQHYRDGGYGTKIAMNPSGSVVGVDLIFRHFLKLSGLASLVESGDSVIPAHCPARPATDAASTSDSAP